MTTDIDTPFEYVGFIEGKRRIGKFDINDHTIIHF